MGHYIHHVPGRLRVKTAVVRRNETQATRLRDLLTGLNGVHAYEVNTVTGSIIINYNASLTDGYAILIFLKEHGYLGVSTALQYGENPLSLRGGSSMGKAVFGVILEKVVERSTVALIGAIL